MGASPSTGQITVTITGNALPAVATATRFTGVNTSGSNGSGAIEALGTSAGPESDNTNMKIDIATLTNGAWAYGAGIHRAAAADITFTVPGGETEIYRSAAVGSHPDKARVSTWYESVPTAGTVTLGANGDLSANADWAMIAVSIKPAPATPAATFAANEDRPLWGWQKGVTIKRARFVVSNEGTVSSGAVSYQLQVAQTATCSSGTYAAVPTDNSGHWKVVGSANITDGAASSNISSSLTDEATTFVAGQLKDAGQHDRGHHLEW